MAGARARRASVIAGLGLAACRPVAGLEPTPGASATEDPTSEHGEPTEGSAPSAAAEPAAIDKGLIRTVVRSHVGEIRGCYEQGLVADPDLAGRVSVRFTIDPRGLVSEAVIDSSDLPRRSPWSIPTRAPSRPPWATVPWA